MSIKRRHFLLFMGAAVGSSVVGSLGCQSANRRENTGSWIDALLRRQRPEPFEPLRGPMPYDAISVSTDRQPLEYGRYALQDDIVLPEGFTYDTIASWGDPVGNSRFGYNNDYLSFVPTGRNKGYLTINFEYVSSDTWEQTYQEVIGESLPFSEVAEALKNAEGGIVNAFELEDDNLLKAQIEQISRAALVDQGLGIISVRREADGRWIRVEGERDRRISGIAGLEDGRYLSATGPATTVFNKIEVKGYTDGLGDKIVGTFGNCSGGTTPWGTVLSAEENVQFQVPEGVLSDGSSLNPAKVPFNSGFGGLGNVFGLAGNKYGWIVEIDPDNLEDNGTKHTWMGRYRHEAVGVRAERGKKLAFYSGCDRQGGHLYKFISAKKVRNPRSKRNSRLLSDGMLYAAKFNADGTGEWIPLAPETAVNPILPSQVLGNKVTLPSRPDGSFEEITEDAAATKLAEQFATLGDLYEGVPIEKQGAILIDAHFAANAAGATATARPEDTEVAPDGTLFIAFTSGTSGNDGGPDKAIFIGPDGEKEYEAGWIMKLNEVEDDPAALTFNWAMVGNGGEPTDGGLGFANPDNLAFDSRGDLWVVTDMSTGVQNKTIPAQRRDESGEPIVGKGLLGLYGNNSLWKISLSGEDAGTAKMFAYGPMECELTGPVFVGDSATLFIAAQHPGERNGRRTDMATEIRDFEMRTTDGKTFLQEREVPIGSNWPGRTETSPPKPSVIAIRRIERTTIV